MSRLKEIVMTAPFSRNNLYLDRYFPASQPEPTATPVQPDPAPPPGGGGAGAAAGRKLAPVALEDFVGRR